MLRFSRHSPGPLQGRSGIAPGGDEFARVEASIFVSPAITPLDAGAAREFLVDDDEMQWWSEEVRQGLFGSEADIPRNQTTAFFLFWSFALALSAFVVSSLFFISFDALFLDAQLCTPIIFEDYRSLCLQAGGIRRKMSRIER